MAATLADRIKKLRKSSGNLTQTAFGEILGVGKSTIAAIEAGRNKITYDQLQTLVGTLKVNPYYLLNGEGEMFETSSQSSNSKVRLIEGGSPLVTVSARASYSEGSQNSIELPVVKIPGIQDDQAQVFEVEGDSMEPLLSDGDFIACSKLTEARHARSGLMYVVVSKSHGVVVKNVQFSPRSLRCVSQSPEVAPFSIPVSDVLELWEVQVRITRHIYNHSVIVSAMNNATSMRVARVEEGIGKLAEALERLK